MGRTFDVASHRPAFSTRIGGRLLPRTEEVQDQ